LKKLRPPTTEPRITPGDNQDSQPRSLTSPKRICVFTGTRAEYGLLAPLLTRLRDESDIGLQLLVGGNHLATRHGETWHEIKDDGFEISGFIEMVLDGDTPTAVAAALGLGVIRCADHLARLRPDLLLLLGDRYETFAAAQAAMLLRIPIGHIHGGEATEGLIDESIRHALTKMAHLHFTSAAPYRERVIQLGEQPERVFNVGALAVENILKFPHIARTQVENDLGIKPGGDYLLVTFHPVTLASETSTDHLDVILKALEQIPDTQLVVTKSNTDPGGLAIDTRWERYAATAPDRVLLHASLGRRRYLAAMHHATAVVGNSSSGLIEAPVVGVPTVNIGDRQRGRLRPASVLDCPLDSEAITAAILLARSEKVRTIAARRDTPYGTGTASAEIVKILRSFPLQGILKKHFYDLSSLKNEGGPS
jgi:UDP-hydrolysing UDP-N-acetyl-D-glucosamine 2-epimerase